MPPIRRRPVPTPPAGGRPKVAGLTKRPGGAPAEPEVAEVAEQAQVAEPVVEDVVAEETEPVAVEQVEDAAEETTADESRPNWVLPAALVVVALLLVGLGVFFQTRDNATVDMALVDSAATAEVNGQVREGIEKAFSYNFADVDATEKAANELLTGAAKCQYNAVFGPVKTLAPQQKLVVTVKVVASGVTTLRDDRANVLVFVDQVTTRTTDNQTGGGTAMLQASALKSDGRWKIDNLVMFGQTAEQTEQMRQCK
ncbi:hypothetical protein FKR81_36000 [Lentzea tibetensis]|uniref:Mce-associated membrane protein n=1 Tax=Lentzea tibetensis TaxID=2591470 RepID=A0A563EI26_9PSEU|nr:hypothetical protein [Lentzea tibetensis]TWP46344.1 hypothetical protein FKR81_36000 [Lentzea tibetensis]